jgi:hypothetical protein
MFRYCRVCRFLERESEGRISMSKVHEKQIAGIAEMAKAGL